MTRQPRFTNIAHNAKIKTQLIKGFICMRRTVNIYLNGLSYKFTYDALGRVTKITFFYSDDTFHVAGLGRSR